MQPFHTVERFDSFPEYVFSRLSRAVTQIEREKGRPVLNFGIGTPDVPPSSLYTKKLAELVQIAEAYSYPGYGATQTFKNALTSWYLERYGVTLASNGGLLPLCGAKDGIAHLPLALLNEGDQILVPDPGYPAFSGPAKMIGAEVISYNLTPANNFKLDYPEIEQSLTAKTRYIWVNFPSNPTGQIATLADLETLVDFALAHHLLILFDNAYSEITFGGYKAPSIMQVKHAQDIAVEIGSFSKAFSFAGLRMGWIVGNADIIGALAKVKSQMDSGLSLPLQELGAFALSQPDIKWHEAMIESYRMRRDTIAEHLETLGLTFSLPEGSLYIWAQLPDTAPDAEDYCMQILQEKQVLFAPGTAFGANGSRYVRVSIGVNISSIKDYFERCVKK